VVTVELILGPHVIRVISEPELDAGLAEDGVVGRSDPERLTIELRSDLPASVRHEALVHELLHHCWALTSLPEVLGDREEEVVRALSPYLAQVVRVDG
jgi:hypothetical protein